MKYKIIVFVVALVGINLWHPTAPKRNISKVNEMIYEMKTAPKNAPSNARLIHAQGCESLAFHTPGGDIIIDRSKCLTEGYYLFLRKVGSPDRCDSSEIALRPF